LVADDQDLSLSLNRGGHNPHLRGAHLVVAQGFGRRIKVQGGRTGRLPALLVAVLLLAACTSGPATRPAPTPRPGPGQYTGKIGNAAWKADLPQAWNGTLLLYSHGYATPGGDNAASDSGDATTAGWLLDHGYALAGSSYSSTGWALADAFKDQILLLDEFTKRFGKPQRTIAWGHSLGGIITAGLVQLHPDRFAGALPMCGVLAGGIANWNGALDIGFATQVLLDPKLQVVHISNPAANLSQAQADVTEARKTAAGRARLALIAAVGQLPGWFNPLAPEPAADDFVTRAANQSQWESFDFNYIFSFRAELENRAGGNPSWNTGSDYARALAESPARPEVEALYRGAGLDLGTDVAALQAAPRVSADPAAVGYLAKNITFDGRLGVPVLTLHTSDDGLVVPANESAYAAIVAAGPDGEQLRQLFTHRANHCIFTPAEQIAAFQALFSRIDGGSWPALDPATINARAAALGPKYNGGTLPGLAQPIPAPPAFADFHPQPFPRPFDSRDRLP